jgi:hypothetical protein
MVHHNRQPRHGGADLAQDIAGNSKRVDLEALFGHQGQIGDHIWQEAGKVRGTLGWKIPLPMRTPTTFLFAANWVTYWEKVAGAWVTSRLPTTDRIFPSAAAACSI